jgi:hypothetical protein
VLPVLPVLPNWFPQLYPRAPRVFPVYPVLPRAPQLVSPTVAPVLPTSFQASPGVVLGVVQCRNSLLRLASSAGYSVLNRVVQLEPRGMSKPQSFLAKPKPIARSTQCRSINRVEPHNHSIYHNTMVQSFKPASPYMPPASSIHTPCVHNCCLVLPLHVQLPLKVATPLLLQADGIRTLCEHSYCLALHSLCLLFTSIWLSLPLRVAAPLQPLTRSIHTPHVHDCRSAYYQRSHLKLIIT